MKTNMRLIIVSALFCSATSSPSIARPTESKLTSQTQHQLDRFFTSVASGLMGRSFNARTASNKTLVEFGIYECAFNQSTSSKMIKAGQDTCLGISGTDAAASVKKYLGKTVRHTSVPNWPYRNGYYLGDPMSIEQGGPTVTVKRLIANSNQLFAVDLVEHGILDGDPDTNVKATVRRVSSGSKPRYILLTYTRGGSGR